MIGEPHRAAATGLMLMSRADPSHLATSRSAGGSANPGAAPRPPWLAGIPDDFGYDGSTDREWSD